MVPEVRRHRLLHASSFDDTMARTIIIDAEAAVVMWKKYTSQMQSTYLPLANCVKAHTDFIQAPAFHLLVVAVKAEIGGENIMAEDAWRPRR